MGVSQIEHHTPHPRGGVLMRRTLVDPWGCAASPRVLHTRWWRGLEHTVWYVVVDGQLVLGPSGCPTVPLIHHLTKRLLVRHPPLPDSCVTRRLHTLSSHGHVPWHAHSPRCMCGWRLSAYSPFLWIERVFLCSEICHRCAATLLSLLNSDPVFSRWLSLSQER